MVFLEGPCPGDGKANFVKAQRVGGKTEPRLKGMSTSHYKPMDIGKSPKKRGINYLASLEPKIL